MRTIELPARESITCIRGLDFYNRQQDSSDLSNRSMAKSRKSPIFFLIFGTESGQILNVDTNRSGKASFLIQVKLFVSIEMFLLNNNLYFHVV